MKNIIELAQSRGSSATTRSGARRFLMANLPASIPFFRDNFTEGRRMAGRFHASDYRRLQFEKKAASHCKRLGMLTHDFLTEYASATEKGLFREIYPKYTYAEPAGRWAGGDVHLKLSFGETASAEAETQRVWSNNGKWSGNDLHVSIRISFRAYATLGKNLMIGGLLTVDAEQIAPRTYRATWVEQKGALGLKLVEGWIIKGYHSTKKTLAEAEKEVVKARAKLLAPVLANRAAKKALPDLQYEKIWVREMDASETGSCAPGIEQMRREICSKIGSGIGGVRADVLIRHASPSQLPKVLRAVQHAQSRA